MKRIIPHPILVVFLILMWMLLTRFSPGQFLLGTAVALVAGRALSALEVETVRPKNLHRVPSLLWLVFTDILRSNYEVAKLILNNGRGGQRRSGMIELHLDTRDRTALAILSIVITATPGTAWLGWNPRTGTLLLHVFDLVEEEHWHRVIGRYESALGEIFG